MFVLFFPMVIVALICIYEKFLSSSGVLAKIVLGNNCYEMGRIQIRIQEVTIRIKGSGPVQKSYGSGTLPPKHILRLTTIYEKFRH
jgi:hypothetical protein